MGKILIYFIMFSLCSNIFAVPKHNPYEININDFEVKTVNGKDILYLKPNTIKYTETYKHKSTTREIVKINVYDLNADTIQLAIKGPLYKESHAIVYIPLYINVSNVMIDNNLSVSTSGHNIKKLYISIKNKNTIDAKNIAKSIFNDANSNVSNYLLYGKDSKGKNVGYVFVKGKENLGIVFYYPDDFSSILNNMWKGPLDLGWKNTIKNFISIMKKYNPHIKIVEKTKNNSTYLYLTYK